MAPTPGPFDVLRDEHRLLTRLFALHQESLLDRDWVRAQQLLERYCLRMQRHIELEERYLLPPSDTAATGMRWGDEVYRAEHRRIMLLLERIVERVMRAARRGARAAGLITLLDQERTLKHLIEHHHHREEMALFNERRRSLPADIRSELGRALAEAAASAV